MYSLFIDTALVDERPPDNNTSEPKDFQILKTEITQIKLGGLDATQRRKSMKRRSDGMVYIGIWIGIEKNIRGDIVDYSLILQTPEKYFAQRLKVFDSLKTSFRFLP